MKKIIILFMMWFCFIEFIVGCIGLPIMLIQNNFDISLILPFFLTIFIFGFCYFKLNKYAKRKGYLKDKKKNASRNMQVSNKEYETATKTSLDKNDALEKFLNEKTKNDNRIVNETIDLIHNSKNIDTVLGRIQFGYNRGFISSKDELQIESIKRCYQILLDSPTPKNKTKSIEKYISQVNEHKNEFSLQVKQFVETFVQATKKPINIEIKQDLPFDEEYLNTVIEDGKTVREHMQEDYQEAIIRSQGMDQQEDIELNEMEEKFINEFKRTIKPFNLDTEIRYRRMSGKEIDISFKDMQIGRIKLNGRKMWIQVLYNKEPIVKHFDITSLEDAYSHIDEWIEYLNYLIKE